MSAATVVLGRRQSKTLEAAAPDMGHKDEDRYVKVPLMFNSYSTYFSLNKSLDNSSSIKYFYIRIKGLNYLLLFD